MRPSAEDALDSFLSFPVQARRALLAGMIRDFVERDGRDKTLRLLLVNAFHPRTALEQMKVETLAAFSQLPSEGIDALLKPVNPAALNLEDSLSDEQVNQILRLGH